LQADPSSEKEGRIRVVDATDFDAVEVAASRVKDDFARCDHVVACAGVGSGKLGFPFWNLTPQDWAAVLEGNLLTTVNIAHGFVPIMLPAKRGTFAFLSSVAGQIGSQTDPPYSAAKAAVINFAQCAARDLAEHGIRVNTICPGMVKTALNQSVWQAWNDRQTDDKKVPYDEWAGDKIKKLTPLGRWQEPEDIASLAVFLASPKAKNITGQTMYIEGGLLSHP